MPATATKKRKSRIQKVGKISRWGNSLGLRIPREGVEQLRLRDGESVDLEIGADTITIRRGKRRKKWTEAELLRGVTPEMVGGEIDWGGPVGREIL
jgi:antitoxin MazE